MQTNSFLSKYLLKPSGSFQTSTRLQESQLEKQIQHQEKDGSSLQNIHLKLQEEADKIVQWKVTTEISLNRKERELTESQKVIEILRSHLVEERLNSENLSHNLLNEKSKRDQIEEHAQRTRILCDALKQRHEVLEAGIEEFHSIRERLQGLYGGVKIELNTLTGNFHSLSARHQEVVSDITSKADCEKRVLTEEIESLRKNLSLKETNLETLKEEMDFNQLLHGEFNKKLFFLEEKIETVTARYKWTLYELEKLKTIYITTNKDFEEKYFLVQKANSDLEKKSKEANEKLLESRCEFEEAAERVKYLTECNSVLEGKQEEFCQQLEAIIALKGELEKELVLANEKLEEVMVVTSKNENLLRDEIIDLNSNLKHCRDELGIKTEENNQLCNEMKQVKENYSDKERIFREEKYSLKEECLEKEEKIKELNGNLTELQNTYKTTQLEIDSRYSELKSCKEELSCLEQKLSVSDNALNAVTEENGRLRAAVQEQTKTIEEMQNSEKKFDIANESLLKTKEELENEMKKLQTDLKEMEKIVNCEKKNLNNELKKGTKMKARIQSLESKLKEKTASAKTEHDGLVKLTEELKNEIDRSKKEKEELMDTFEGFKEESKAVEKSLKEKLQKMTEEIKLTESKAEESENRSQLAKTEADLKIQEMMAMSEMWKKENEKELELKEKELEEINKENEGLKESLEMNTKDKDTLLEMKSNLESTVCSLTEALQCKEQEKNEISDKLALQNGEFNQLKNAIKRLTGSPNRQLFDNESLKTPSPSVYLPIIEEDKGFSKMSSGTNSVVSEMMSPQGSTASGRAIDAGMQIARKPSRTSLASVNHNSTSILKPTAIREMMRPKNVTFHSPIFYAPDSDSSEGFAVDIISDSEDRFETIRRSSNVRLCTPSMKRIPKANIQPIPRSSPHQSQNEARTQGSAMKRPRLEKSSIRTYLSPKEKRK